MPVMLCEIKRDLAQLRGDANREFTEIRGKLTLVQWMLGVVIAASVTILI